MKPEMTIQKLKDKSSITLTALGDSLTNGWLADKGYLDFLREMLEEKYPHCDLHIINSGIPGDTAFGGLHRLDEDVINHHPDIVFIQFALNDAFSGYSPGDFMDNVQGIIDEIHSKSAAEIVLITSVHIFYKMENDVATIFYNLLNKLALKNKLPIAKVHEHWKSSIDENESGRYVQDDGIHPNSEGYRIMAEAIMKVF